MKKLINLAGILSLFLLFSCGNLIENKNTSVRVVLPEAENVARTIGISYELADVVEYTIVFEGEKFNNTYNCNPGDDLYIDEINAGEYKVTGYAKNKDGECIGYGITAAVVLPEQENEVEIVLKKNIVSNIATVIPSRTKQSLEIGSEVSINRSAITPDIKLEVTYLSGYTTTIGLEEILDTGFFFANTYLVYPDGKKEQTDRIDYKAKELIFEVCMYDCSFNDFIKAKENPELAKELLQKQKTLFEFSYSLELLNVIFPIYDDEDTTVCHKETYTLESDIELQTPVARAGFGFIGWYYYNGNEEVAAIPGNKILISEISNYLDAEGCIRGKWEVTDLTKIDLSSVNVENYPNGFTLKLNQSHFDATEQNYTKLKSILNLKESGSNLLINLDMYECTLNSFTYNEGDSEKFVSFSNCANLRSLKIPNTQDFELLPDSFAKCSNLKEVYIPKNYGGSNSAFSGIYNDCVFIIEDGAESVTNTINGKKYPSMLFSVDDLSYTLCEDCGMPVNGVKEIPEGVLALANSYNGAEFDTVKIPASLMSAYTEGPSAFIGAKIEKFEIASDNQYLYVLKGDDTYNMLVQKSEDYKMLIYDRAKFDNSAYKRTIPDGVNYIAPRVYHQSAISVTIPQYVTYIEGGAFGGYTGIITIVDNKLWTIVGTDYPLVDAIKLSYTAYKNAVYVTGGFENLLSAINEVTEDTYIRYDGVLSADNIRKEGDTSETSGILYSAVANARKNLVLDLSKCSATTIPENAFFNCSGLIGIYLPSGVEEIEQFAFEGTGLTEITIPASVTTIGGSVITNLGTGHYTFEDSDNWQYYYNEWQDCLDDEDLKVRINEGKPLQKKNE